MEGLNPEKCERIIQNGIRKNNGNSIRRRYELNSIPAFPGVKPREKEYWAALADKYPPDDDYLTGNIRKLQLKVVAKLADHISVLYDKTDENPVSELLRICTDQLCMNIPHKNKTFGSQENKGRMSEFMGRHNIMIALLTSDGGGGGLNPLGDEAGRGGVHAVTICKDSENEGKYSVFDSTGYYGGCSKGYINLLNFAGNDVSNIAQLHLFERLRDEWLETPEGVRYNQLFLPIRADSEYIKRPECDAYQRNTILMRMKTALENPVFVRLSKKMEILQGKIDNYEDYLFQGTNMIPVKCPVQKSRPVCVFWSIFRALHPEKSLEESACMMATALEKSGLNSEELSRVISEDEKFDLLLLHIFEEFVEANDTRNSEQRRINRWVLGGKRTCKRKNKKNKKTLKR